MKLNTTTMKKYDIFISYSRKDFDEVNAIVEMLKSRIPTLNCWFDITGIESGDEFEDKIITAIDNSSYVLFALSDNSIQSQWAKDEVMYAKNTDTKVIPLVLKGAQLKGWFLFKFGRIDCIDTANSLQIEKLIKNLEDWTGKASVKCSDSNSSVRSSKAYGSSAKGEIKKDNVRASSSNIQTIYGSDGKLEYVGEVKNGKRNGQGTYYYANGCKYEGQWKEDKKHGQGTENYISGNRYEGQYADGQRNGQGTYYFTSGAKYVGQFKYGLYHGQGALYLADGRKYEGQWADDKKHGQGTFFWPDGDKYVGQWENDKRHGQGTYFYKNGCKYEGQWKEGKKHGQGTYYTSIGSKYVGEWKDNKENGVGTFYFHHGDKYVGQYTDGYRHGQGTYYYADGRQEIRTYNNGVLIENPSKKS